MSKKAPSSPRGRHHRGVALQQAAKYLRSEAWLSAEGLLSVMLEDDPSDAEALALFAELCFRQARLTEAVAAFDRAVELRPRDAELRFNRGTSLAALRRYGEALRDYDAALAAGMHDAGLLVNRGNVLHALERYGEALTCFDQAAARDPRDARAHYNRGNTLRALARNAEAVEAYERALALDPRMSEAMVNLGTVLAVVGRHQEAIALYDRALAIDESNADAHYNRANALRALERDAEAVASYDRALALRPAHADTHWNRAWALLALGDYVRGWPEHEWRLKRSQLPLPPVASDAPVWNGDSDPAGKRILVLSEQGAGDTLQFLRYVPMLAERGAQILLELPPALRRLCGSYGRYATFVDRDESIEPHDLQIPMASLPYAFRTTLETIPAQIPYLAADPELVDSWARRLARAGPERRIGLAWAGNPRQGSEARRGVGLAAYLPLLDVPGLHWFSLQVGERAADLRQSPGERIVDLSSAIGDYADTAAVIEQLDLVISSDTSVAHLAGALGKPVWVLLMFASDWRWLRDRTDSPWYPTARLFRQAVAGDWAGVVGDVRRELLSMTH
jgi:tetratricopeptide (TPR) repeat protein